MKLSKAQRHVIERMQNGWELGVSTSTTYGGAWLQKDGIGKGGKSESVSAATVRALYRLGLITGARSFPTTKYALTASGKEMAP